MAAKKKSSRAVSSKKKPSGKKSTKTRASGKKSAARTKKKAPARRKAAPKRRSGGGGDDLPTDLLDLRAIEHLSKLMDSSGLQEIEVQDGPDRMLRLSRRAGDGGPIVYSAGAPAAAPASGPAAPVADAAAAPTAAAPEAATDYEEFVSPMVGTFYRAGSPESPPYVTPGDKVGPDTVLCIIEAMKVMNEVKSEISGEVVDVLVENGEAVEFGQPLFHIRTSR